MFKVGIITASDKGSQGLREDLSGQTIKEIMGEAGYEITSYQVVADEIDQLKKAMITMSDIEKIHLILTTGGTGFSQRDVTPEATKAIIQREVPGIPEAMRAYSLQITPRAMLSRATAGIRGTTLIINLPGSPKAVKETLTYILPSLEHGVQILLGTTGECAR